MRLTPGTYELGPDDGTLSVRTGRTGAAAKAGHDLLLHVTAWRATLEVDDDAAPARIAVEADATSLRVREGTGGLRALDQDDKANIEQTIDDEVLRRQPVEFSSTSVRTTDDGRSRIEGELTLVGKTRPIAFDAVVDGEGRVTAALVVRQTEWGITPYSALFGALRVADEVEVAFDGRLASP